MQTSSLAPSGIFDVITGLPVHPLVVHVAVVLLPLSAMALVVLVFLPRWRGRYGWLTLVGLAVGTVAAFVAKESGEALARRVGQPEDHAVWGDRLPPVALILLLVAIVWFVLDRRSNKPDARQSPAVLGVGLVAALLAVAATGMTVLVGHSGATAVWAGRVETSTASGPAVATLSNRASSSKSTGTASTSSVPAYTLTAVKAHGSSTSCWAAINGNVYDLTQWINAHPGGPSRILQLCGTDATAAFDSQHASQKAANNALAGYLLGKLS